MYVKRTGGRIMLFTKYVDDIQLARNNMEMIKATKKWLSSVFEMKDIGEARCVLDVDIVRSCPTKLLGMCREASIKRLLDLERFQMYISKPINAPVEKGLILSFDQCP